MVAQGRRFWEERAQGGAGRRLTVGQHMAGDIPFDFVPPVDPNIGRRVDRYFIIRKVLGRGGMGAAYLAAHEAREHIKCVVKLMLVELARHPMGILRHQTEAEAVSLLKHEGIVKLENLGVLEDGQLYMRFEFVDGKPLDRYVAEQGGRLSLRETAYLTFQVCDALQYAHDAGVVHRDLKPDNLMVEFNPRGSHLTKRIKVLDFGIAKVAGSAQQTGSGVTMGTPRFMAPEQVSTAASVDGRADVFSLGVIFYWCLSGMLPWGMPDNDMAIYHLQQTRPPDPLPADLVPPAVAALIMRCLSLKPSDRPTMHEFAVELACAIAGADGQQSGLEILKDVVPHWVHTSPDHMQTLRNPAGAARGAALRPVLPGEAIGGMRAGHLPPLNVVTASQVASAQDAAPAAKPATSLTAPSRPRAPAASAVGVALHPSPAGDLRPPLPAPAGEALRAALPTGLNSQGYPVQEGPSAPREPLAAVASEIELAAGTPAPHIPTDLPLVVVSTQLRGPSQQEGAPRRGVPEAAPFVVLPGVAARARRRMRLALAAIGGVLAVAVLVAVRLGSSGGTGRSSVVAPAAPPGAASATDRRAATTATTTIAEPAAPPMADATPKDVAARGATVATQAAKPHDTAAVSAQAASQKPARDPAALELVTPSATHERSAPGPSSAEAPRARVPSPPVAPAPVGRGPAAPGPGEHSSRDTTAPPSAPRAAATASADKGELVIQVDSWADLWVNGKENEAPYRAKVPAGRYRLRLKHEDKDESITVVVHPGQTTTVTRNW